MKESTVLYRAAGMQFRSDAIGGSVFRLRILGEADNDIYGVVSTLKSIDGVEFPSLCIENANGKPCPVIPVLMDQKGQFEFTKIADSVEAFMDEAGKQKDRRALLSLYGAASNSLGLVTSDSMAINVIAWLARAGYNAEVIQAVIQDSEDKEANTKQIAEDVKSIAHFVDDFIKTLSESAAK